jgi:cell division protein FtsW (lipid II flippase)
MAWIGYFSKKDWQPADRKLGSYFSIAVDVQLLLGLLLYLFLSPVTRTAMQNFSAAMSVSDLRFFALEHPFYMILALVFAHLGSILPRRTTDTPRKFLLAAIFITLSVLLILLGNPWGRPLFPGLG